MKFSSTVWILSWVKTAAVTEILSLLLSEEVPAVEEAISPAQSPLVTLTFQKHIHRKEKYLEAEPKALGVLCVCVCVSSTSTSLYIHTILPKVLTHLSRSLNSTVLGLFSDTFSWLYFRSLRSASVFSRCSAPLCFWVTGVIRTLLYLSSSHLSW